MLAGLVPLGGRKYSALVLAAIPLCWATRRTRAYLVGIVPLVAHLLVARTSVFESVFASRLSVNAQTSLSNIDAKVWVLLSLCAISIAIQAHASRMRGLSGALLLSCALLGILMMPQTLQRTDIYHTIFAGCVILPAGIATIALRLERSPSEVFSGTRRSAEVITFGAVVAIAIAAISVLNFQVRWSTTTMSGRSLPTLAEADDRLTRVADALHRNVPRGSKVFMGSLDMSRPGVTDAALYYLMPEYRSPFYYLGWRPGRPSEPARLCSTTS